MRKSGKILRFDDVRGYGFIVPDDGGIDVFVHANDLGDDKSLFTTGTAVEFESMEGERGPKAFAVRLVEGGQSAPPEESASADSKPTDDNLCDVLAPAEFRQEVTELLLNDVPDLTGSQIVLLRNSLLASAQKHGWVD